LQPTVARLPEESTHCWQVPPSTLSLQKQVAQLEVEGADWHFRHARCCE
jgi:hypothetical protein